MMRTGGDLVTALLPLLSPREAWAVGLVVVLALLRPVGPLGWAVAGALLAGGAGSVLTGTAAGWLAWWQALPWLALALLLGAAATGRPLRWEPRSGPSTATALLVGAAIVHLGQAWHAAGGALAEVGARWGAADPLGPAQLTPEVAGPLAWPLAWVLQALPLVAPSHAAAALGFAAVLLVVLGAGLVARRWGYTGTARSTAAAVAWAPPLLLAHGDAVVALLAAAALVWSWWALGEVWAGRHLPDRMALLSGGLLGAGAGTGLWTLVVLPLWLGRLGGRRAGWFVVGLLAAAVAVALSVVPTAVGLDDLWATAVAGVVGRGLPVVVAVLVAVAAVVVGLWRAPLSPTRLSALSAALLALTVPWWPPNAPLGGPLAAIPFVLLAAVAPDHPGERWPPDATLPSDERSLRVGS